MKNGKWFLSLLIALAGLSAWAEKPENPPEPPPLEPPVYESKEPGKNTVLRAELTPAERQRRDAARKRRFEIMVLIHAWKIMPEPERAPLKAELLKRIEADFRVAISEQKARITAAEADLTRLRQEVAEREENSAKLVERELDRLLKMPVPPMKQRRVRNAPAANSGDVPAAAAGDRKGHSDRRGPEQVQ